MAAINGNVAALRGAFMWSETEQGHDYWSANLRAGFLGEDARRQLQTWIAEEEAAAIPEQGDIVRALASNNPGDEFTAGREYEVEGSDGVYLNVIADDAGDRNGWSFSQFELVQRQEAA